MVLVAMLVGTAVIAVITMTGPKSVAQQSSLKTSPLRVEGEFPSLDGATEWLNTQPLSNARLRGKIVLVDFWTYSCINWRRTLPYVRAWAEKYKDQGLVVIGVHTPEFEFEKRLDNVRWALEDMGIRYPVAIDSSHTLWRAFRNDYWPALYFVDAQGRIRHHQFGEGGYETAEKVIQQLLAEAGASLPKNLASVDPEGAELAADWNNLKSPENYLGYELTNNFVSRDGTIADKPHLYVAPPSLRLNHWALAGNWVVGPTSVTSTLAHATLFYQFHARDLHLVMGPAVSGRSVHFRVSIDGQPVNPAAGVDIDSQGNGTVTQQRLYQLIRQTLPILDHQLSIEFLDAGAEVFSVTFG
jgi:thiol-disulfide isomerase/thioredoxin